MEDYSVLQGPTVLEVLFALFSVLIASLAYLSWKRSIRRMNTAGPKPPGASPSGLPQGDMDSHQIFCTPALTPVPAKKEKSAVGDWLAPIVVWAAVLWITLAVVSLMLGES